MFGHIHGFNSLEEAAEAVAACLPHRTRPRSPEGLKKNLRHRNGRWHWHWDPAFIAHNCREPDRGVIERAAFAARSIRVPTLLIRGAESDVVTAEGASELLSVIPGSRMVDVAEAGHMVAGDDNDIFCVAVEGFLRDLQPRA